jgi:hypothetical protein
MQEHCGGDSSFCSAQLMKVLCCRARRSVT